MTDGMAIVDTQARTGYEPQGLVCERPVPPEHEQLCSWITERRAEGHCAAQIFNAAVSGGWGREAAAAALQQGWSGTLEPREVDALVRGCPGLLHDSPSSLLVHGRVVQVLLEVHNPQMVLFDGFLDDDECDELVEIAKSRLDRSTVMAAADGRSHAVSDHRTSHGTFLRRGENLEICHRIDARTQALLNWPVDFTEDLQVLCYDEGAQYKTHYDYFSLAQGHWSPHLRAGGNRCGTLVMYLNTPARGGGTTFPDVPMEVFARKGAAVYFGYPMPDAASRTAHGGSPVIEGEKWAAVKWFRQGPIRLPTLAGAAL